MAIVQISRLMHRRGLRVDLPIPLNDAEFGWAQDTRELFIGNGPFFGGNTQILTNVSPATLPNYSYISHTGTEAVTGVDLSGDVTEPNASVPTIRNYQEKFDDFVNVRDYGATGDYPNVLSDDTGALIRAMRDIYDETSGAFDPRRKRAVYLPAGRYRISQAIPLYPFCNIIGDGQGRTIIFLDSTLTPASAFTGNDCVARTVDSKGDNALNIGTDTPLYLPQNIKVSGVTFESNTPQTDWSPGSLAFNGGVKEILKLDQVQDVRFDDCEVVGTWELADVNVFNGSVGVLISRTGNTSVDVKNFTFSNCTFRNLVHAFNVLDTVSDVYVYGSEFKDLHHPIQVGWNPVFNIAPGVGVGIDPPAPELFRVSHSRFVDYEDNAFNVRSVGRGNISSYNHYGVNDPGPAASTAAVYFHDISRGAISIGDTFDEVGFWSCDDKLLNLRVQNHSTTNDNIVMNTQDEFQIPFGFCGDITINGNLTVTGSLFVTGSTINTSIPIFAAGGTIVSTIPYADGNVIHFEYGMREAGDNLFRVGIMKIIHDDNPFSTIITYDDNYTEVGGPLTNPITLSAVANDVLEQVEITVDSGILTPIFNFTIRIMSV